MRTETDDVALDEINAFSAGTPDVVSATTAADANFCPAKGWGGGRCRAAGSGKWLRWIVWCGGVGCDGT